MTLFWHLHTSHWLEDTDFFRGISLIWKSRKHFAVLSIIRVVINQWQTARRALINQRETFLQERTWNEFGMKGSYFIPQISASQLTGLIFYSLKSSMLCLHSCLYLPAFCGIQLMNFTKIGNRRSVLFIYKASLINFASSLSWKTLLEAYFTSYLISSKVNHVSERSSKCFLC